MTGEHEASYNELLAAIADGDRLAFDEPYCRAFTWLHILLSRS